MRLRNLYQTHYFSRCVTRTLPSFVAGGAVHVECSSAKKNVVPYLGTGDLSACC